ncbi:MAG TPA: MMPL family transporter, partial [Acidimicrobiales bacterium]|nr:MMPL family transporter [Acidimicrobiales bacterium]
FAILGRHLFWPLGPGRPGRGTQVGKEARLVARHPGAVAAVVGTVLVGLAVGSISYTPTYNTLSELPASTPSQQAYNTLLTGFPPGALAPTQVYVTGAAPLSQASLGGVTATLSSTPGVAGVAPPQLSADARTALISVVLADNPYSNAALDLVGGPLPARAQAAAGGNRVLVGGQTATLANVRQALHASMKVVFPVAFGIIALILGALLEAVLAPVNLLVCVGLTVAATLGATSLVFLEGAGRSGIDFTLPIVIYLFVVAIGTDYNILLSSRLREEYLGGFLPRDAARAAITNDAPTVAAAGIILAGTFASLTLAGIANLTELGFAVSVGILLAAFGVAPLLVSALSALEGHRFWWPGHARRVAAPSPAPPQANGAHGRAAADGGNGQVGAEELPRDPAPPRGE